MFGSFFTCCWGLVSLCSCNGLFVLGGRMVMLGEENKAALVVEKLT